MTDYGINESDFSADFDQGSTNENVEVSTTTQSNEPQPQTFEYQANGKTISEDINTILKRAGMGYNYAQHMQDFKQKQSDLESRFQQAESIEKKWKPYEEYATQNPDWANHVRTAYEQRTTFNPDGTGQPIGQSPSNAQTPELQSLMQELNELKKFRDDYNNDKQLMAQQQQDQELNEQIKGVQSEYPDIDFSHTDPTTGKSLEFQVLEHGNTHGISNFRAAFRDFYHDQLVSRATTQAQEQVAKSLQQRQQKGFMSSSDTPQLVTNNNTHSYKNKSYHELIMEGAQEENLF